LQRGVDGKGMRNRFEERGEIPKKREHCREKTNQSKHEGVQKGWGKKKEKGKDPGDKNWENGKKKKRK